jgi:hypothetical protein
MKASVWNILSVAFLVGTVFLVVIFMLIFLLPNQVLPSSMRPISVPPTLVMPSPTETVFQFPPTWTKSPRPVTPSDTPIPPTNTVGVLPSDTPATSGTVGFVLPTESPTPSSSPTKTSTITKTLSSSKVVIINGTARTFTKTKKATATKTKLPSNTPGGIPPFNAVDDEATVSPHPSSVLINVLANDYNSTGSPIHIVGIPNYPDHGNLDVVSSTTIKYWPDDGYLGMDSFMYKMQNESGSTDSAWVTIYVMDGSNEVPTDIDPDSFDFDENQPAGIEIGQLDTVDDAGPFVYKFMTGTGSSGNDKFKLTSSGQLLSKAVYDFEQYASYSIRVRSTDPGGLFVDKVIYVYIHDLNEPPLIRSQDVVTGKENKAFSYTFSVYDPDVLDTISIAIEPLANLPPGLVFQDMGNKTAKITGTPTLKGDYTFNIHAMDAAGLEVVKSIKITIEDGPTVTPSATSTP